MDFMLIFEGARRSVRSWVREELRRENDVKGVKVTRPLRCQAAVLSPSASIDSLKPIAWRMLRRLLNSGFPRPESIR